MIKNFRKTTLKLFSLVLALLLGLGGFTRVSAVENTPEKLDKAKIQRMKEELSKLPREKVSKIEAGKQNPEELVRVIVEMTEKPAAEKFSKSLKASPQEINSVKETQKIVKDKAKTLQGASIRHSYGNLVNGFSMDVKRKEIDKLKKMAGVKSVKEVNRYELDMTSAKNLTQAYEAWEKYNLKGEGMLVSIVDTGVDYRHKDMKAPKDSSKLKLTKANIDELKKSGVLKAGKDTETYFTDKIPYGYNYADKNNEVIDKRPDAGHGMHVSGIVGADGDENEVKNGQAVQGVAPEAQLLAMKVFSNGPRGKSAYTDDIVAAIEDSVTLGADIINMSLGSPAGFQDEDDIEQKAIFNATNKGVTVVVSAGNSSYSTAPYRDSTMKDISTVGAPALSKDALMVANYQNPKVTSYAVSFLNESEIELSKTPYTNHTFSFENNKKYEMVNCGVGKPENFTGKDLNGKVALIIRGEIAFTEKILNAQKANAIGVIIYNNGANGDALLNMATDPAINIPAIFIGNTVGKSIAEKLDKNELVKFIFTGATMSQDNPEANDYDDSTSWGAAPNLEFKPQIAGPGGNIFSTVNDNRYENMSGTSMAAPHVSGGMALILQSIKAYNNTLNGRGLVDYAKNIAMNTSSVKMDSKGVPYSPRRQGSGVIQISNAIKNKVTATYKGNAAVSLKEIKEKKVSFTIDLNNYGDKDVTYTLETIKGVLTSIQMGKTNEMASDTILDSKDASMSFDAESVTVKANGSAKVNVTLNIGNDLETEKFLEGYIKFNSANSEENPSLVVPFMGYYGDWSKEKIVNYTAWENADTLMADIDKNGQFEGAPALVSKAALFLANGDGYAIADPDVIAISPNDDGDYDEVIPYLYMLRNSKKIITEVLDKNGNVVVNAGEDNNVRKQIYNASNGSGKSPILRENLKWNGKIYNSSKGEYEVVPEGEYKLNIKSYVDLPGAKSQDFVIPVKVDVTAPNIEILSPKNSETTTYNVQWKESDNLSGVDVRGIFVNGNFIRDAKINYNKDTKIYSADVILKDGVANDVMVVALDNANNFGYSQITVQAGKIVPCVITFDNNDFASASMELTEKGLTPAGKYIITGKLTSQPKVFTIAKKDVKINKDLTFSIELDGKEFKQGLNYIPVYAENSDGSVANVLVEGEKSPANYSVKLYYDSEAPIINLTAPLLNKSGQASVNKDEVTLKGVVSDSGMGYTFYINGEVVKRVEVEANYGHEATAYNFEKTISVKNGDILELKAIDLFGHKTVKTVKVIVDKETPVVAVTGVENEKVYNTSVAPVIKVDDVEAEVTAVLNGKEYDGKEITEEGKYELVITAVDKAGNKAEAVVKFSIDKTAPKITVTGAENGKAYNTSIAPIIKVDEEATITTTLNGKEYDGKEITEEGNYELAIGAVDKAGNKTEVLVKFSIDKTAPKVELTGVEDEKAYNTSINPVIKVNDKEATVTTTLNGKPYDGKEISEEGKYELVVTAVDKANNKTEVLVKFVIDKTAPIIQVKGIEAGKVYDKEVTPIISVNEKDAAVKFMLDGQEYDGKSPISKIGKHKIEITATDLAGNTSNLVVEFEIKAASNNGGNNNSGGNTGGSNTNNNNTGKPSTGTTNNDKLAKTGSSINKNLLVFGGATLLVVGVFLAIRKKTRKEN
ncbi:lactocepin [Clostridium amylolyticum]|uniref:Lactocepin n=1 Tax=Clostridium amylolyticum TaxID=1121298 RepID=A0A1M6I1S0_9CLOT|nr:S8 family serine peptidase [Clostridium amylolyticum]SHJ28413.1 lactocepin [Clostridium amylolyticum]